MHVETLCKLAVAASCLEHVASCHDCPGKIVAHHEIATDHAVRRMLWPSAIPQNLETNVSFARHLETFPSRAENRDLENVNLRDHEFLPDVISDCSPDVDVLVVGLEVSPKTTVTI